MKNLRQGGGLAFRITLMVLISSGCAQPAVQPPPTHPAAKPTLTLAVSEPLPTEPPYTIADVEKLSGLDVKEPTYLPKGVVFDFATYQPPPSLSVTLHFKFVHETYGDMGAFFQIVQAPQAEALTDPNACGDCEIIPLDGISVLYLFTDPTESLTWTADGFSFLLVRTAGEPNKIYKDELLKVVESLK